MSLARERFRWGAAALVLALAAPVVRAVGDDPFAGTAEQAYFPFKPGARLQYVTSTTLDPNVKLHWSLAHVRTIAAEAGGEQVTLKLLSHRWQRQEQFLRDYRGVFVPLADGGVEPLPLLPPTDRLAQPDTVWRFSGPRALPFGLHLLGLIRANDVPVATDGSYHVRAIEPVETPAGAFAAGVEVTAIERVRMILLGTEPEDVLLRCRRTYVAGLGLVLEHLRFLDLPRLGTLTTELTQYEGLTATPSTARATVAARPVEPGESRR